MILLLSPPHRKSAKRYGPLTLNNSLTMKRPYCDNCKIIWSKYASDSVKYCLTCNNRIKIKTFYPELKVVGGVIIILFALFTLFSEDSSVIWIGGFLFGGSLIGLGIDQSSTINKLDRDSEPNIPKQKPKEKKPDPNNIVITCGNCGNQINVKKGQGIVTIQCSKCLGQYNVRS